MVNLPLIIESSEKVMNRPGPPFCLGTSYVSLGKSFHFLWTFFPIFKVNMVMCKVPDTQSSSGLLWELLLRKPSGVREDGKEQEEIVIALRPSLPPSLLQQNLSSKLILNFPSIAELWKLYHWVLLQLLAVTDLSFIFPGVRHEEWIELSEWLTRHSSFESHQGRRRIVLEAAGLRPIPWVVLSNSCFWRCLGVRSDCKFGRVPVPSVFTSWPLIPLLWWMDWEWEKSGWWPVLPGQYILWMYFWY